MSGESEPLLRSSVQAHSPQSLTSWKLVVMILSLYIGVFIAALDATMVTGLLSHISSELQELKRISWIGTGYLVSYAAFQPIYGKLSDIYGRKSILVFCNFMFGLGCFICWLGKDFEALVAGRVVSGIGGGGMLSLSSITVSDFIPVRKRGVYQGYGNIAYGLGAGCGGVFGGIVSETLGWRAAFGLQVPVIALSTAACFLYAPGRPQDDAAVDELVPRLEPEAIEEAIQEESHGQPHSHTHEHFVPKNSFSRIDFLGIFWLVVMLISMMFAIATGGVQFPWSSSYILTAICVALISAALFVYTEMKVAKEPVLPISLLGHRTILGASLTNLFMTNSVFIMLYFAPVHLSSVFNLNATQVGYRLVANFIGVASGSLLSGIYMQKTGKYWWLGVSSPVIYLLGVFLQSRLNPYTVGGMYVVLQFVAMLFLGLGYAAMLTVTLLALVAALPHEFQAVTTSIQYTCRGVGSTLGVALGASVFQNVLSSSLYAEIPEYPDVIESVLSSVEAIRQAPLELQPVIIEGYDHACKMVFATATIFTFLSIVFMGSMKEHKLHSSMARDD